jgi:2-polyprenyl-3-methyl-5-hydroxy-6-metoxy-1,4-benzoquinol methylase
MGRRKIFEHYRSSFHESVNPLDEVAFGAFHLNYRSLLPVDHKAAILDLGCGSGAFLRYLAREGFSNTLGVEVSREQVEYCLREGMTNVTLVDQPAEFLRERQETFDFILMRDVLEHVEKQTIVPLLESIQGALKSGGLLVLRVPNAVGIAASFSRYIDFTHELIFTELSLAQVLKEAQFSEVQVLPKKTFYRSKVRGWAFEKVRSAYFRWLRWLYFMENPGASYPRICSAAIIGVAKR